VVDSEIFNAVRDGRVAVVGELLCFEENGVRVADDKVVSCERVVFATGYRRDVAWAADALTIADTGVPAHRGGLSTDIKGLAFMGIPCMRTRRSGFIRGFTGDARAIVAGLL
jgi:putative flavoprotein involved in K+ transport